MKTSCFNCGALIETDTKTVKFPIHKDHIELDIKFCLSCNCAIETPNSEVLKIKKKLKELKLC